MSKFDIDLPLRERGCFGGRCRSRTFLQMSVPTCEWIINGIHIGEVVNVLRKNQTWFFFFLNE